MARAVTPLLMFDGTAEEAMTFYVSLFVRSAIQRVECYGAGEQGAEGSIKRAEFTLAGQVLLCIDSPVKHAFTFTPSISMFVDCESATELDRAFEALAEGGAIFMPLDNYGFSERFGWVSDQFGVSWQLNLDSSPRSRAAR